MPKAPAKGRVRSGVGVCAVVLLTASCGPSVTVQRLVPAPYNLGPAKRLVLVELAGPSDALSLVAPRFLSAVRKGGIFEIGDATREDVRLAQLGSGSAARDAKAFRRQWPADVYFRVEVADLGARRHSETKKEKDKDGEEREKRRFWAEGVCELMVSMIDARDGREVATFRVRQTRNSYKLSAWESQLADSAAENAVDAAVDEAVAQFTPQRVQERLELDDKAPLAKEGVKLIEAGDLRAARRLWEEGLPRFPESAPLHYNLGSLSEALADPKAAREYYEEAIRLNPSEEKFRLALEALEQRLRDAEALRKRG
jgi:tetratricopeptide (TPR) repeat protein